ncbi:MAG: 50S ribosomal protein L24 [bacterium]
MKIKKGDTVRIMKGKDVGKQGKVLKIVSGDKRVVVEGVNVFKKHIKGDGKNKESAIVDIVKPVSIANVMIVCNSCGKASRVRISVVKDKRIRMCVKCDKPMDVVAKKEKKEVKSGTTKSKKVNSKAKKSKK